MKSKLFTSYQQVEAEGDKIMETALITSEQMVDTSKFANYKQLKSLFINSTFLLNGI
jgi:hypothetical protein